MKEKNRLKYLWGSSVYLDLDTAELNRKYKNIDLNKYFCLKITDFKKSNNVLNDNLDLQELQEQHKRNQRQFPDQQRRYLRYLLFEGVSEIIICFQDIKRSRIIFCIVWPNLINLSCLPQIKNLNRRFKFLIFNFESVV